jgi:hypothetical protein
MDNQDTTNKIKKIVIDGVPYTADKSRNISSVFAVVQHKPGIVRGDSGADILSGQEKAYVRRHYPSDVREYMDRYLLALRSRPAHPSRWVREEQAREAMRRARAHNAGE